MTPSRRYRTLPSADLSGKKVLLRAGFDVPVTDGKVTDATRIESLMPTMRMILDKGGLLILMAHQGRPKDGPDPAFSQKPLVPVLQDLLGTTVHFASDCIGTPAQEAIAAAAPGEVVLLENLRFHPEEKKNDPDFGRKLASLADVYVNDAFTNCHRDHASMVTVPSLLPAYMGLLLEKEVMHLTPLLEAPERPLTLIISGAKMETKVPVIERFLSMGDDVLLGGCIANTFIAAEDHAIGTSKYEEEFVSVARTLLAKSGAKGMARIHVPIDAVTATEISDQAVTSTVDAAHVPDDAMILDVADATLATYEAVLASAKTIVWNGPLGLSEHEPFAHGTKRLAAAVAQATARGATTIIGGGDTLEFHERYGFPLDAYTFVSTGGGAMLEFLAGERFASLEVLQEK